MKLQEFIDFLNGEVEKELVFRLGNDEIERDYHITEVFSSKVTAIDCGGKVDAWDETVLQLLVPTQRNGERFMNNKKALKILDKSFKRIDFHESSSLILEFKPQDSSVAHRYIVSDIYVERNKLIVLSEGFTTQCKAAIRSNPDGIDTCCDPKVKKQSSATSCCAPADKDKVSRTSCCG